MRLRLAPPRPFPLPRTRAGHLIRALTLAALGAGSPVAASAAETDATPVTAARLDALAVAVERSAPANVHALARTPVAARLAAEISATKVEVGDRVQAGAPLVQLECSDYRDALEQARASLNETEARLRLARIQLERTRRLREQDAVPAEQLDQADAERAALAASVTARREQVAAARRDVERCSVEAPFTGLVLERPAATGAFVQPGTRLVELVAVERIELRAPLTAADAATVEQTPRAWFTTGDARYAVELITVLAAADTAARTRLSRWRFTDGQPVPGAAGRVRWVAQRRAVPAELLMRRDGALGVFRVDGDRARFHAIPGATEGRPAPTRLPADTRLIVDGRQGLSDGAAVQVVE